MSKVDWPKRIGTWPPIDNWCRTGRAPHGCKCDGCVAFRAANARKKAKNATTT